MALTAMELNFDELKSEGSDEEHAGAIWRPSQCLLEDGRKPRKPVTRTFRMRTDI
jgi:hypothetical protein